MYLQTGSHVVLLTYLSNLESLIRDLLLINIPRASLVILSGHSKSPLDNLTEP